MEVWGPEGEGGSSCGEGDIVASEGGWASCFSLEQEVGASMLTGAIEDDVSS